MYRRTVRCRHCGKSGHNVAGCVERKEWIKNNPNSYAAQRYKEKLENAKHRKCSYCKEQGHNVKTCSISMQNMLRIADVNIKFRRSFIQMCKDRGIGVGTLVKFKSYSGYDDNKDYKNFEDALGLITEVNFESVKIPNNYNSCAPFRIDMCSAKDWNGRNAVHAPSMPVWWLMGKDKNPYEQSWYSNLTDEFEVVGPSYLVLDDEEKVIRDSNIVKDVHSRYDNYNLNRALEHTAKLF